MGNPFKTSYSQDKDHELIEAALHGSRTALEALVKRHQDYLYNVALKLVLSPADAQDLTQEVLVKAITKLSSFKGESEFRTWLYRIAFNHFLNMKRRKMEEFVVSFDQYGEDLDRIPFEEMDPEEQVEKKEMIEDAKIGCMSGMLLCLDRDQRLVYVLGEIFEADHNIGAEVLGISKANFRQKLSRARKDLYQFMNRKCGLVNAANPCRCHRKTKGFIKAGWVNAENLQFNADYTQRVVAAAGEKSDALDSLMENSYRSHFQSHPFQEKQAGERTIRNLLEDKRLNDIFNLN